MKIALIYPRLLHQFKSNLFPLGIVYIGTILKKEGYDIKIFDSSWDKNLNKIKKQIHKYNPEVVGISATSDLMENVKEMSDFCKELDAKVILGGPHASVQPKESLEFINSLDFVVVGEGERVILELIKAIREKTKFNQIKGVAYRDKEKIKISPTKNNVNLNELPFPDRSLIPNYNKYLDSDIIGIDIVRGCPYKCNFCEPNMIGGHKVKYRDPRKVATEIKRLYNRYKKKEFYISSDLFTGNHILIKKLYEELKKNKLTNKVEFIILSRVDLFTEELAVLLKKMNVTRILFGVESGSQKILDYLNKGINLNKIKNAFKIAKKYNFKTHMLLMLGSPLETEETLLETKKLVEDINPTHVMFSLFTALPGTYFYKFFEKQNKLDVKSYEQFDYYTYTNHGQNVKLENLDYQNIIKFKNKLLRQRKLNVFFNNAMDLFKDIVFYGDIKKLISRWRTYNRCKTFFG